MKIFSEKGISVIAAAGIMVLLSVLGFSLASQVTTSHEINVEQAVYDRAAYVTQAGLEYAMRRIYEGVSPVVSEPGVGFGGGSFVIDRQDKLVTVTGRQGVSQVAHSVTSPSHADCTEFDLSNADVDDEQIRHISFQKICLEQTVLDKIVVYWTNPGSEGLTKVRVENQTLYNNPAVPNGQLTELSDYVMTGNQNNSMNYIEFSNDMEGKDFTIDFLMGDGSIKSFSIEGEDDG